jgi:hypothetical protein
MDPYHINVNEQGASAKISKNKRRKLQRYNRIETSEPEVDYRFRKILKAQIPFFRGALGSTDYIWRRLEENAMVYRKGRR